MHIAVDRDACCGSGNCTLTAPQVFDQDDEDGLVVLLDPDPPIEVQPLVRRAAYQCPAAAITVLDS
jgi:ferredoxin